MSGSFKILGEGAKGQDGVGQVRTRETLSGWRETEKASGPLREMRVGADRHIGQAQHNKVRILAEDGRDIERS